MTRRNTRSQAQSLVEFALILPLLLMLILGVIDVSRGVLAITSLANAVREGARAGAIAYPATGWDTQATNRVRSTATLLNQADLTLTAVTVTDSGATYVSVTGQYTFRPIAPYVTMMLTQIPLSSNTRMRTG